MLTMGCTGEAAAASLTMDLSLLAVVARRSLTTYQTSCFCPATRFAGLKGSSLLVVADMARGRRQLVGHLKVADGLFVEGWIDLIAGVTILRMAVSLAHKETLKSHELQRLARESLLVRSIACSSPSSAVIKRGQFRENAGLARRVTPE